MSKLSEAIDKARREGRIGRTPEEHLASPVAAFESATILPLTPARPRTATTARAAATETGEWRERPAPAPRVSRERGDTHARPEEHMVSLINPHSSEAEQFRTLRHLVEQCHRDAGLRVVAVTSAAQGDGKSLVAVNLAGALAQSPQARVLLVDADLRGPSIRSLTGLSGPARGLTELAGDPGLELQDVTVTRPAYNLTILQAGAPVESPYEVLKSDRFANLMLEARALFDFVVIDSPPALFFPDTRLLDEYVDGFLFVVGADRTPRKRVEEAARIFPGDKLLGLVFNGQSGEKVYRYGGSHESARKGASRWSWWRRWRR